MEQPSFLFPHEELERLAQDCASSDAKTTETDITQFKSLQSEAKRLAKAVMNTGKIQHQAAWKAFLPILDNMQKLLSQRGANHKEAEAGLPDWKSWWNAFRDVNHITISFRTVQYRLNRFREVPGTERQCRSRVSRLEQLRLAQTAKAGYHLAAVCKSGMGSVGESQVFYRESLPLETVEEILDRLSSTAEHVRPADQTGLGKAFILSVGGRIRERMQGLSQSEASEFLQATFSGIVDAFCHGRGIQVRVEHATAASSTENRPLSRAFVQDAA